MKKGMGGDRNERGKEIRRGEEDRRWIRGKVEGGGRVMELELPNHEERRWENTEQDEPAQVHTYPLRPRTSIQRIIIAECISTRQLNQD